MTRYWRLIKSLIKLRWRILPPQQKNVLLYFQTGADVIKPYFSRDEIQILDIRENEVNLAVALLCALDRDLSAQNYASRYINIVKPKLIITFIDNYPPFFQIKNKFPEIHTILIQNGARADPHDLFSENSNQSQLGKNRVDDMFVLGSAIGSIYGRYISGKITVIGSFKNNLVPINKTKSRTLAYISTHRAGIPRTFIAPDSISTHPVTYGEIIDRREQTIIFLAKFCESHNLDLLIVGKDEDFVAENAYYSQLLKKFSWKLSSRRTSTSNYDKLDASEIVVFTSSTLGYESLARGNKTAGFLLDAEIIPIPSLKFGWPVNLTEDGKFWTNRYDEQRFEEILNYLLTVSDVDWEKIRSETIKEIISYDTNNSQFVEIVRSLRAEW